MKSVVVIEISNFFDTRVLYIVFLDGNLMENLVFSSYKSLQEYLNTLGDCNVKKFTFSVRPSDFDFYFKHYCLSKNCI